MLIRKIKNLGCWDRENIKTSIARADADIPGDTISDLRTANNALSVWYTPDLDSSNLDPILAALAVNMDSVQKFSYVIMDESELHDIEIECATIIGCAPGVKEEVLKLHRDLLHIDYTRLGKLANYIYDLKEAGKIRTVSKTEVKKLVNRLIEEGKIKKEELKEKFRISLG